VQFVLDHPDCVAFMPHVNWPQSNDPFYVHNTADNNGRRALYGVNAVPFEILDGVLEPVYFYTYARILAAYNTRKAVPTDVTLSYTGLYVPSTGQVDFTVTASTTSALPAGDFRLHIVLTESGIFYDAANGIDYHEFTLRKMFPTFNGTSVSFSGGFPQTAQASTSFTLNPAYVPANCKLVYFLQNHTTKEVFQAGQITLDDIQDLTDVAELPLRLRLGANYPNPFNPSTTIPLSLDAEASVRLAVHDAAGRELRVLHDGALPAGSREFHWDGRDAAGQTLPSGVYLFRVTGAGETAGRRALLLK